ncbi:MAG TPA: NAD-dependent epimerase/dehydratase family protein [Acidimicrobiales bacterium]|nr:NAD-dependent epimerase/dehydratase family protein [Acidimicrobiales bacterium]
MKAIVTGCAGFIGSTISDALLARGDSVLGVDCFTDYYDRESKESNLAGALRHPSFGFVETDLRFAVIEPLLDGVDVVFHQAAQAGVRLSWSDRFAEYESHNVLATQRLLEAAKHVGGPKVVYASSSSVYGNAARYPTRETDLPAPHSPYGVTKLAAEHLCNLYASNWGVQTVSLRYFTVYGPRQRPDMACHRLIEAALSGSAFPMYGDGSAVRDFTFVGDIAAANLAAADAECAPGTVLNVAGGSSIAMADLIALVGELVGTPPALDRLAPQPGDVARTGGTIDRARDSLAWEPAVDLRDGLTAQVAWHRARRN